MCVKVIARQNSDIFLRHSVVLKIWGGTHPGIYPVTKTS